jgi:hypothetical protein
MTTEDGEYAIRNRNGWGGRDRVDGPLPRSPEVDGVEADPNVAADRGVEPDGDQATSEEIADTTGDCCPSGDCS